VINVDLSDPQTDSIGVYDSSIKLASFGKNVTLLWAAWTHSTALSVDSTETFKADLNLDASTLLAFATAASTTWSPTDISDKSIYLKNIFPIVTRVSGGNFSADVTLYLIVGASPTHAIDGGSIMYESGSNLYHLGISCGAHGTLSWEYSTNPGSQDSGSLDGDSETTTHNADFDATQPLVLTAVPAALYAVDAWTCSITGSEDGDEFTIGGSAQWGALADFPTAIGTNVTISVSFALA
jgi:hypothetical protein